MAPSDQSRRDHGYSYWLRFLTDHDPLAMQTTPAARASSDRLHVYSKVLLSRMTAMGAAAALGHLALALRAIVPAIT